MAPLPSKPRPLFANQGVIEPGKLAERTMGDFAVAIYRLAGRGPIAPRIKSSRIGPSLTRSGAYRGLVASPAAVKVHGRRARISSRALRPAPLCRGLPTCAPRLQYRRIVPRRFISTRRRLYRALADSFSLGRDEPLRISRVSALFRRRCVGRASLCGETAARYIGAGLGQKRVSAGRFGVE